jgi:hypothetical protein
VLAAVKAALVDYRSITVQPIPLNCFELLGPQAAETIANAVRLAENSPAKTKVGRVNKSI